VKNDTASAADLVGQYRRDLVVVRRGGDQLVEQHHGAARRRSGRSSI
jgi:hypothetical protein